MSFAILAVKAEINMDGEENMEEFWLPVIDYENLYEVSNLGNIRNAKTKKIRRVHNHRQGYKLVTLLRGGEHKTYLVHRIVAIAFIENPYSLSEINHKDENKQNNRVDNLEWCDRLYNANYGTGKRRSVEQRIKNGNNTGSKKSRNKGENNPNCKLSADQIKYIRENFKRNDKEFGGVALAKKFGVGAGHIYRIISNKRRVNE